MGWLARWFDLRLRPTLARIVATSRGGLAQASGAYTFPCAEGVHNIMRQFMRPSTKSKKKLLVACFAFFLNGIACAADGDARQSSLCPQSVEAMNRSFVTVKGLDGSYFFPLDSGLIVHTIDWPEALDMEALEALRVDASKTCGEFMSMSPPIHLPWCGSNKGSVQKLDDSSSWTYLRSDTLINVNGRNDKHPNEVFCSEKNDRMYGLIFSNAYMNASKNHGVSENFGCMYPLDGDTAKRQKKGCGKSENPGIVTTDAQGECRFGEGIDQYMADFNKLLTDQDGEYAPYAGSLVCSLSRMEQFDLWVSARKRIDLSRTEWPVNEFVLLNWNTYSTSALAENKFLIGFYYQTGCQGPSKDGHVIDLPDGSRARAERFAKLYKTWSGVDLPVVNLSNAAMRENSGTPFSCN